VSCFTRPGSPVITLLGDRTRAVALPRSSPCPQTPLPRSRSCRGHGGSGGRSPSGPGPGGWTPGQHSIRRSRVRIPLGARAALRHRVEPLVAEQAAGQRAGDGQQEPESTEAPRGLGLVGGQGGQLGVGLLADVDHGGQRRA